MITLASGVFREAPSDIAGFVVIDVRDGEGYLEEVDVLPTFGRRGIGRRTRPRSASRWRAASSCAESFDVGPPRALGMGSQSSWQRTTCCALAPPRWVFVSRAIG